MMRTHSLSFPLFSFIFLSFLSFFFLSFNFFFLFFYPHLILRSSSISTLFLLSHRNEEAKKSLPKELRGARPLTVPQAKGLEFDDVLLLNFFSDSLVKKEWRVLINYLDELEACETSAHRLRPAAEAAAGVGKLGHNALRALEASGLIDPASIRALCDELKHLYTALTRAKNFVAIVDSDAEARAPFYYFLSRLGLGKVVTDVGEINKKHLGLSKHESTATDWAQRGAALMELKLFEYAAQDFEKAGDLAMGQFCEAHSNMALAMEKAAEQPSEARKLYLTAGLQLVDLAVNGQRPKEVIEALSRVRWRVFSAFFFSFSFFSPLYFIITNFY